MNTRCVSRIAVIKADEIGVHSVIKLQLQSIPLFF